MTNNETIKRRKELLEAIAFDLKNDPRCWQHNIVNHLDELSKRDLALILLSLDIETLRLSSLDNYTELLKLTSIRLEQHIQMLD